MSLVLYVDDTTALVKSADVSDALQITVTALCRLSNCLAANRLKLNKSKTKLKFMDFSPRFQFLDSKIPGSISCGQLTISIVCLFKLLGLVLYERLTSDTHVSQVCSKLARSVNVLYKLLYYINKIWSQKLYSAYCLFDINYCNVLHTCRQSVELKDLSELKGCAPMGQIYCICT